MQRSEKAAVPGADLMPTVSLLQCCPRKEENQAL